MSDGLKKSIERDIAGRKLVIETGQVAKQAGGAVIVRYEETAVFCAVTQSSPPRGIDFFPLTVDYREKTYAAGKIPGGFFKREGRPTTKEILTSRLVDRPIRPLFPDGFCRDVAINVMAMSADKNNDPDLLAVISASAALSISEIPVTAPVAAVRIGLIEDEFVINPTYEERDQSSLDLVVAGTRDAVTMVECGADQISEELILDAIEEAHEVIIAIVEGIEELTEMVGKEKMEFEAPEENTELLEKMMASGFDKVTEAIQVKGKFARKDAEKEVLAALVEEFSPEDSDDESLPEAKEVKELFSKLTKKAERQLIANTKTRSDGRSTTDIRDINVDYGLLPATHGTALFTRGETQAVVTVTLGTGRDDQRIDGLRGEQRDNFMLHYNFPSYCVGETWPNRGPKRREIGHGNLAERSLRAVLPPKEDFPYTVRIVSEITESNGSSSMASVCGGTLAMMDAGVQISQPVAGIAMGLIKEGDEVCVLSDILGSEDHNGDMDFKVAGTQRGVTALQMDIKINGVDREVMETALNQAKDGRLHILREMLTDLKRPREEMHPDAPKLVRIRINPEKIGIVIGPGGKMIKSIQEETGTTIEIEDTGMVTVWGTNAAGSEAAQRKIEMLTEDVKENQVYGGKVVSVKDFGCFVEVLPGQEGLLHISEISDGFVENVSDEVSVGDAIEVKVIGIDPQGRIRLSRKVLLEERGESSSSEGGEEESEENIGWDNNDREQSGPRDRGGRDRDRGGRDRGGRDRDRGGRDRGGRDRDYRGGGDRDRDYRRGSNDRDRDGGRDGGNRGGGRYDNDRDRGGDRDRSDRYDRGGSGGGGYDRGPRSGGRSRSGGGNSNRDSGGRGGRSRRY